MNIVKHIPNTITSMNLLCGIVGVTFAFQGELSMAFYMMIAAAVFDFLDGFSARLLNAYSDMGKELDSLADMVSFGALPALMLHRLMIYTGEDGILSYIPLAIGIFSALRLAKFNIDTRQSESFIGLATPACAMICGSFAYYVCNDPTCIMYEWAACRFFLPSASLILSALLVSEIPMFSMKIKKGSQTDRATRIMRTCFFAVIAISCILAMIFGLNWSIIVLTAFTAYILINTGAFLLKR